MRIFTAKRLPLLRSSRTDPFVEANIGVPFIENEIAQVIEPPVSNGGRPDDGFIQASHMLFIRVFDKRFEIVPRSASY